MLFNSPIPRAAQPKFHESSDLRSVRDSDANSKLWQKTRKTTSQENSNTNAITGLQRQVNQLRRRIVGGGSSAVSGMNFRGEYDPTSSYSVQDVVFIRSGSSAGAFICVKEGSNSTTPPTNPDAGNNYWMAWPGSLPLGQWM